MSAHRMLGSPVVRVAFGAKCWLLTPAGAPITTSAPSSSSSSSGGGMGYGY